MSSKTVQVSEIKKVCQTPKNKRKEIGSLREYLDYCGGYEVYRFDTQQEADELGNKLRDLAMKEEGAKDIYSLEEFSVEITYKTVRIRVNKPDLSQV